jgi:hypothetical protein
MAALGQARCLQFLAPTGRWPARATIWSNGRIVMPEEETLERAREDEEEGKAPSTQAGEFVREEMHHIREGQHGAQSPQQAIAIGLSKARRAGVDLPPPKRGKASEKTRQSAKRAYEAGQGTRKPKPRPAAGKAVKAALKREGSQAASPKALSKQASSAAARRTKAERSAAAKKAARTKGPAKRSAAAKKAASTRARSTAGKSSAGSTKRSGTTKRSAGRTSGAKKGSGSTKKGTRSRARS